MPMIKCCLGCPDRKIVDGVRCHSWCERYAREAAENREMLRRKYLDGLSRQYAGDLVAEKKDESAKYRKRRRH